MLVVREPGPERRDKAECREQVRMDTVPYEHIDERPDDRVDAASQ
jgi:hypothetical protein